MHSEVEKQYVKRLRESGKSFKEIAEMLNLTINTCITMVHYKNKTYKMKRGPKSKLSKTDKLSVKREISRLKNNQEKVNCSKLKENCNLDVSTRTLQRHMINLKLKYRNKQKRIFLSKNHRQKRVECVNKWIIENHPWHKTIFSDEKRFNLDGPDSWKTYEEKHENYFRQKRQCNGSSILIWLMILPNGLLSYKVIDGNLNSAKYINLILINNVPIMKLNCGDDFWYQEDNAAVHKSCIVRNFMNASNINVLSWPARSPDINIVEDVWRIMSGLVYDGPQFQNKRLLLEKIHAVIYELNTTRRSTILNLYSDIKRRLCKILCNNGNLCNRSL